MSTKSFLKKEKPVVQIEFYDHMQLSNVRFEEVEKQQPPSVVATGELLFEDDKCYKIVCYRDTAHETDEKFTPDNQNYIILKCAVKRVTAFCPTDTKEFEI